MNDQQTICSDPATGEQIGRSALNTIEDVHQAAARARQAQPRWAALDIKERVERIRIVRDYLVTHADELAAVIARDNGKTRTDALLTEILPAALAVDYYCRKARSFLKDRRLMPGTVLTAFKSAKIVRVPFGVVGIISPWNYPFAIPFSEVIMALLAGNAVLLKMATETQMVARSLERCMAAAGLPEGLFNHLNLPGSQAGGAFLEAGIDKLFFTGSVAVGKKLMAQAAQHLTPLVLELGGNDPMLVCPDANLQRAAAGAAWAGLQNCGQTCGGVERIYVHRSVYEPFLEALAAHVKKLRVGRDTDFQVDLGAMTTARQTAAVRGQVEAALQAGAHIYAQSNVPEDAGDHFLPAMVLTDVDHTMEIMTAETFGPVVGVMAVDSMAQAVELANDSDLGLTASVWTTQAKAGRQLARQIKAGVVTLNDHLVSHGLAETPWGGFKQSGIGRTHGAIGMQEMTQPQCLVDDLLIGVKRNLWSHPNSRSYYKGLKGMLDLLYGRTLKNRLVGLWRTILILPRIFRQGP